ncbi:hypothetical protein G7Z17_g4573 [Cylindrodendrum hubeiense]|uniref:Major facilitator superfamily (MFS) profile domain-containing protein n=1 Tax=Cylindrodendrum hubeiense TaxID=595255 RepID=A0A9P5H8L4_9HYPO|nr:hypothetical protein G7Z17_g4573 [Cylindrodendrum hubeiense]
MSKESADNLGTVEAENAENTSVVDEADVKAVSDTVLLFPRPTQDPNDPLNWPRHEKFATYLTVCFFTILSTFNSSNFTVAIGPLATEFNVSTTKAGYLVCFNVLLLGVGNPFWVASMRVVGKRPVYLASLLLFIATNTWSYEANTYGSLLASRILSGFASSAADATVPALVADMFFIHERGHCMMIFHLALSCGFFLGPLICAYITQEAGWRWTCGFLAIAGAFTGLVGFFSIHESNYNREKADTELPASSYGPKKSFAANLSITGGYDREASFWKTMRIILSLTAYPAIPWTGFTIGAFVGWNIVVQLTASRTFTAAPYGWEIGSLGLLSISGLIGALLAFFAGGKLTDIIANRMTKANNGIRLPEFRLPALILPAFVGPVGILIFGLCVAYKTHWIGPAVGYAMQGFGLTAVANVLITYAVDGYQPFAGECLVIIFVIRNAIATILALYTSDWQLATGVKNAFGEMVGIQYFLLLFAFPMYFYATQLQEIPQETVHDKWGWVIYRCTYGDDVAWTRFKDIINLRSRQATAESDTPEYVNSLEWKFVDDQHMLEGATRDQLRIHFRKWATEAIKVECPNCPNEYVDCFPRYNYFIQVDEDVLRSVVYEAPQPPNRDLWGEGYVKFVHAHWKSQLELYPDEVNVDEQSYEPVDGCCEEDVGWMMIASDLMERTFYDSWNSRETWYIDYRRPPDMLYY